MEDRQKQSDIKITDVLQKASLTNHSAILFKILKDENFPEMSNCICMFKKHKNCKGKNGIAQSYNNEISWL